MFQRSCLVNLDFSLGDWPRTHPTCEPRFPNFDMSLPNGSVGSWTPNPLEAFTPELWQSNLPDRIMFLGRPTLMLKGRNDWWPCGNLGLRLSF